MYIGSVRFFKHLILTVIALLIIVPAIGCVYFAVQYKNLEAQVAFQFGLMVPLSAEPEGAGGGGEADNMPDGGEAGNMPVGEAGHASAVPISYQLMYPHLYVENDFLYADEAEKTVYLTFDDGPTALTPQVLDILKDRGVSATFFVVYRRGDFAEEMYRRIVDEGHVLAHHSASHDYNKIYSSVEAFLDDFALLSDMLETVTGVKPELFRFPGGSVNSYNKEIHVELSAEMLRRGYTYYDWDVSAGSSTSTADRDSIFANVLNGISGKDTAVVLLHDAGTRATVEALPDIIEGLLASGYRFGALDQTVRPICFDYL